MAQKRIRARVWPIVAGAVADAAIDGLSKIELEAASVLGQSRAISGVAEGCISTLHEGDVESAIRMVLSIRELSIAQQQACVNIRDRATTHRAALAGARRGEY